MATLDFEVDNYRYSVYTQADTGLVWDNHHLKVRGLIICESKTGYRAVIYALADNSFIPMNRYQEDSKRVFIFTRERQFEWFRDLLRNEKPVFCRADPAHPGWFTLSTDAEPVGEEET
jgi:hypothetical protein